MEITGQAVFFAFLLSAFAGLSTGIGGLIAVGKKPISSRGLSMAMGLSAGVMIYISFVELLSGAFSSLESEMGTKGSWIALGGFFIGISFIAIIDKLIPEDENPHEFLGVDQVVSQKDKHEQLKGKMMRTGLLSALAIGIHNFPEGMASFFSALSDPALGISIAIAIAIHNIPEGISVAVPIRVATESRFKAAGAALLSGIAEPIGALIGFVILMPFISETILSVVFAFIAGIMVYISVDELLPAAEQSGEHHIAIWGFILGMAIMGVSLILTA